MSIVLQWAIILLGVDTLVSLLFSAIDAIEKPVYKSTHKR